MSVSTGAEEGRFWSEVGKVRSKERYGGGRDARFEREWRTVREYEPEVQATELDLKNRFRKTDFLKVKAKPRHFFCTTHGTAWLHPRP